MPHVHGGGVNLQRCKNLPLCLNRFYMRGIETGFVWTIQQDSFNAYTTLLWKFQLVRWNVLAEERHKEQVGFLAWLIRKEIRVWPNFISNAQSRRTVNMLSKHVVLGNHAMLTGGRAEHPAKSPARNRVLNGSDVSVNHVIRVVAYEEWRRAQVRANVKTNSTLFATRFTSSSNQPVVCVCWTCVRIAFSRAVFLRFPPPRMYRTCTVCGGHPDGAGECTCRAQQLQVSASRGALEDFTKSSRLPCWWANLESMPVSRNVFFFVGGWSSKARVPLRCNASFVKLQRARW